MISEATAVLRGENECHYLDKNTVIWVKNESRWGEHDTERDITKKEEEDGWCNLWRASKGLYNHMDEMFWLLLVWDLEKCQNVRA